MANTLLNIKCDPDLECSKTGEISDFINIYPGFETTRNITISNNRSIDCDLTIKPFASQSSEIFKFTKLFLSDKEITINQESYIGKFIKGQKSEYLLKLAVDNNAGNNFANLSETLDLSFLINCSESSSSASPSGTVAGVSTTNKCTNCCWWLYLLIIINIIYILFKIFKNRKKEKFPKHH